MGMGNKVNIKGILIALFCIFVALSSNAYAQRWDFTSSVEGWTKRNSVTNVRWSGDGGGRLYMDTYGNDPGMVSPTLSLSTSSNNLIRLYAWTYCSADRNAEIFFMRSGSSTVYSGGMINLSYGSSGGTYEFDMRGNVNWTGTITQLRIDPTNSCGSPSSPGFIAFDWIETSYRANNPPVITGFSLSQYEISNGWSLSGTLSSYEPNGDSYSCTYQVNGGTWQSTGTTNGTFSITGLTVGNNVSGASNSIGLKCTDSYGAYGNWSSPPTVIDYAVPNTAPSAVSPVGTISAQSNYQFTFGAATDAFSVNAHHYQATIADNISFSNPVYDNEVAGSPFSVSSSVLPAGKTYYWKICGENKLGSQGPCSNTTSFTIPLPPPTLISPIGGAKVYQDASGKVNLTWANVSGNNGYLMIVDSMSPIPMSVNQTTYAASLPAGATHTWQMCTKNSAGTCGNYSSPVQSFYILPMPTISSTSYSINVGDSVTLTCDLSTAGAGRGVDFRINNQAGTTISSLQNVTTNGSGTYSWSRTSDSGWSPKVSVVCLDYVTQTASSFKDITVNQPALNFPTLVSPINGNNLTGPGYVFNWNSVSGAGGYHIKISTDSTFATTIVNDQGIAGSATSYTYNGSLTWDTMHYWQMRTLNSSGTQWGTWSPVQSFVPVQATAQYPTLTPLYRLYKSSIQDHFYTVSATERDFAVSSRGFNYERVEGFVSTSNFVGSKSLYRLYHATNDVHFYTTVVSERDAKIAAGYTLEGVTGYVYSTQAEYTAPLYYAAKTANTDNFYTTSRFEYDHAINTWGFVGKGVIGYVATKVANNRPQGFFGGIAMAVGNLTLPAVTDLSLNGVGAQLAFTRYYNSRSPESFMGNGWTFNYDSYITEDTDESVHVEWGNGGESHFDSNLVPYPGYFEKAVKINDGINYGYDITTKDQTLYKFRRFTLSNPGPDILLIEIIDRYGNSLGLGRYASYGMVISATDSTSRTFSYTYTPKTVNGKTVQRLTRVTDTSLTPNRTINFAYNAQGNLSSVTDARNNTTSYTYNADGLLDGIIYPEGNSVSVTYDDMQQVTSYSNGAVSLSFDYQGGTTGTTVKTGTTTLANYVPDNQYRASQINFPDSSFIKPTYLTGNFLNLQDSVKDRNGNTSYFTYDANGNVLTVKNALNEITTFTYDSKNNLRTVKDARNNMTTYNYDVNMINLTSVVKPLTGTTQYTYYSNGLVQTVTDPNNHTLAYTYDANGNLLQSHDNTLGTNINMTYDNAGRLTSKTDQMVKTTYFYYDANDNLTQITDADTGIATFTFDRNNRLTAVKDPKGQSTGKTTSYTYNSLNQLQSMADQMGNAYGYAYDSKGNLSTVNAPDGTSITYTYNATDNRPYQVKLNGTPKVTYNSYDNNGNLLSMTDENGSRSLAYDALNRIQIYVDSFSKTVSYGYDASGNINVITYPGNKVVNYLYDADNRLSQVTDWLGSGSTIYTYDSAGILRSVTNPNGTKTDYSFDSANRPTGLSNKKADSSVFSSYVFTLNNVGNPTQSIVNQPSIPTVTVANVSYAYDDASRLTTAGGVSYTYDPKGNLSGFGGNTFTFDYANRLTQASIGGINYSYLYDGFGNRIARTKGGVQTKYVLDVNGDMSDVLAETDASGAIQNYYIYGHGLISKITNAGQRYVYHYDTLGDTIAITDASGNFTEQYGYDEFGKALSVSETNPNPFRYVGKYGVMDEGNGLLFMRARYYDVDNGRFISKDPIGFEGGDLNLYAYVGGNPVTGIDPEGLSGKKSSLKSGKEMFLKATDLVESLNKYSNLKHVHHGGQLKINLLQSSLSNKHLIMGGIAKYAPHVQFANFIYELSGYIASRYYQKKDGYKVESNFSLLNVAKAVPYVGIALEWMEMEAEAMVSVLYLTNTIRQR